MIYRQPRKSRHSNKHSLFCLCLSLESYISHINIKESVLECAFTMLPLFLCSSWQTNPVHCLIVIVFVATFFFLISFLRMNLSCFIRKDEQKCEFISGLSLDSSRPSASRCPYFYCLSQSRRPPPSYCSRLSHSKASPFKITKLPISIYQYQRTRVDD